MSERDGNNEFMAAMLALAIIALCGFISYSSSQIRDLQRRVGELESRQ